MVSWQRKKYICKKKNITISANQVDEIWTMLVTVLFAEKTLCPVIEKKSLVVVTLFSNRWFIPYLNQQLSEPTE